MSHQSRRELLAQVTPRYREADHPQKTLILDEFLASTGYARKYAIKLLTAPVVPPATPISRPRARSYGAEVQEALVTAWAAANFICAKRLVPFLPELVAALERHGHLSLSNETRIQLLAMSPATADRILQPRRQEAGLRGIGTTKAGTLLKHQVPVRTFADWSDERPGFVEADLVAHCGTSAEGAFLHTLVLTDIATGWTEWLPLLHRSQEAVIEALKRARQLLPFPVLGLDTDNGSEFLNGQLIAYCRQEKITFTRGRAYKKNDQCFVEQKNGVVVRQLVGYDRFEGQRAYEQLVELYRAVRLYVNFFQPSMKLLSKKRDGAKVSRTYDSALTPYQRLVNVAVLPEAAAGRLESFARALDPVLLLRQLESLQDALWRHVAFTGAPCPVKLAAIPAPGVPEPPRPLPTDPLAPRPKRRYRRSGKPRAPRTWRTHPDAFASVWGEVTVWLGAEPDRTAKELFQRLQALHPGAYTDGQLRTLQRRVKEWRKQALLTFDDRWLEEDLLAQTILPRPLQATAGCPSSTES
jgi:hypothetical protein